jgi:sugar phosphate isomerase/epimerase
MISLELCWGTVRAGTVEDLLRAAAAGGFDAVTVTPHMVAPYFADGAPSLRGLSADLGVQISVIDPLIAALPGSPGPDEVAPEYRQFFAYGEAEAFATAELTGAPTVNLAHFLGRPTDRSELVDAVGGICERAGRRGLAVSLEFIPGTGVPDLPTAMAILTAVNASNSGVCLDNWHLARSGGTRADVQALPAGSIRVLQLSDRVEPPSGQGYVVMADRLIPGAGEQDVLGLTQAALAVSPGLRIGVEVFNSALQGLPADEAARTVGQATLAVLGPLNGVGTLRR